MTAALAAGIVAFLVVPFLIPNESSGTLSNVETAGEDAEFFEVDGLQVHVETADYAGSSAGPAPLLLMLHGFGASTFSWREVMQPLTQFGDVVAYDRPAFGFTDRPLTWGEVNPYGFEGNFEILRALIERFGENRPVILVGHSAGGQLAAEYARLNPDDVDALVLVSASILTTGGYPDWLSWIYDIPQIERLGPILVASIASSGEDLLRESFVDQSLLAPEVYAGYRLPLKVKGWEQGFWNFVKAPRTNQLAENLGQLELPILLITGDTDTVVPTADSPKLAALLPSAVLEVVPAAGHLPHEERPEAFMLAIANNWSVLNPS
jgi:pimeloyl-ACP methyl ester carboxylesterase